MNIGQIYELAVKLGIEADPRGKNGVERWLKLEKKKYDKLSKEDKEFFDKEKLTNPYSDSRLHWGDAKKEVKNVLAGIDIEVGEIALVKALNKEIDLIITHHPVGKALAELSDVMHMQADMMASYGVPINVAEGVSRERIAKVARGLSPINHNREIDAAKLANLPIMNIHTPADNQVFQFLQNLVDNPPSGEKIETVGEIVDLLKTVPEYHEAAINGSGPVIFAGDANSRAGRIVAFDITGGTSGAKEIYPELVRAGVGTIIGMHMNEESREEAAKNHLNIVIAGHMSSDSLGMNIFLDHLSKEGIEIVPISGLIRIKR